MATGMTLVTSFSANALWMLKHCSRPISTPEVTVLVMMLSLKRLNYNGMT
jgi:hypothetical protein